LHRLTGRYRRISKELKTVVWFGNAGREGDGVGIESLISLSDQLEEVNHIYPLQLLVISHGYSIFREATKDFRIPCIYREWSIFGTLDLLRKSNVVVIPNPNTNFARAKSANRCMLALLAGLPVIASRIPALDEFAQCVVLDDWKNGLMRYLGNPNVAAKDVSIGQSLIQKKYNEISIAHYWEKILVNQG